MEYGQRKSASAAATDRDAKRKKLHLHITTTLRPCQILFGTTSWVSFLGLLGVLGGMDNETIGFVLGMIWAAIFMAAWIASLAAGGWLE
jgi:hypothetical protein